MSFSRSARGVASLFVVATVATSSSCRSDRDAPATPPAATAVDVGSHDDDTDDALDLTALVDDATIGFERNGQRYERDATTYRSRIDDDGTATLVLRDGPEVRVASSFDHPTSAAPPIGARDGSVTVEHVRADGIRIVERFRNTRDGLSQSWELARTPLRAGEDAFLVHVALSGVRYSDVTRTGHHFVDAAGRPALRYGNATFVDRDRRRSALEVIRDRDGVAVVVPRSVLERASYPAIIDPILGPENVLDPPAAVLDRGGQPAVHPGPSGSFLVAWGMRYGILARRVLADGTLVDPGIVVPLASGFVRPVLAWNPIAAQWLVVGRSRSGSTLRGVRIAGSGALVDAEPFTLLGAEGGPSIEGATVGFDGAGWLVAANDTNPASGDRELSAYRVSAAGKVTSPRIVVSTSASANAFGVACATTACLVGWNDGAGVHATRVSPANAVLDPAGKDLGSGGVASAAVATDGSAFAVAWSNGASVVAARVGADGTVLDSPALSVAASSDATICWNGTSYAIGFRTGTTTTSGRRLLPSGTFVDASSVALLTMPSSFAAYLGCSGSEHFAVASLNPTSMRGARVSSAFAPLDAAPGINISKASGEQRAESAAWNGTTGYVVWNDLRGGQNPQQVGVGDLYGVRVSTTGAPIGSATVIATGMYDAEVASDGKDFFVVWPDGPTNGAASRSVKAVRVSAASGALLDSPPLVLTTDMWSRSRAGKPHVAYDGKNYVVTWPDARKFGLTTSDVFAARVSSDGQILDPNGIAVSVAVEEQASPAIASDGTGSFIVWNDGRNDYPNYDLYGARLSQAGTVLDPNGIALAVAGHNQFEPVVAWDGTNYQVAWLDARRLADERYDDVYTARVSPTGTVLDPLGRVVAEIGSYANLAIAPMGDGRTSLVAFDEAGIDAPEVRGTWIRAKSGDVLDLGGVPLAPRPSAYVALAAAGPGRALFMYSRVRGEEMNLRTFARFVTTGATDGTACTTEKECSGRFCRDAVCCNEACDAPCRTCGANGACVPVTGADDPDSCTGTSTCDATGACKKKSGSSCDAAAECASGFCADGFCCETACDGACDVCNAPPGKCTVLPARSPGTPACLPLVCNGASGACPAKCLSDDDCTDGFGCDRPSGTCRNGPVCTDLVTVRSPTRAISECRPYTCNEGACRTSCSTVSDCAFPAKCDENGRCVTADGDDSGGCAVGGARANDPWWLLGLVVVFGRRRRKAER